MSRAEEEAARRAREVTGRAIKRLDLLEWVILLVAVVVALVGGALVALLAGASLGWDIRTTWVVASLLLFGVPGFVALRRARLEEEESRRRRSKAEGLGRTGSGHEHTRGNGGHHG